MKTEWRLFAAAGAFFAVVAPLYGLTSDERAGSVMLALPIGSLLLIGHTGRGFWDIAAVHEKTLAASAFKNTTLWVADYGPYTQKKEPQLPAGGWSNYTFWQFSPSTVIAGIGKPADGDSFNGTSTDLQALAGL